jgi:hypothetical protein
VIKLGGLLREVGHVPSLGDNLGQAASLNGLGLAYLRSRQLGMRLIEGGVAGQAPGQCHVRWQVAQRGAHICAVGDQVDGAVSAGCRDDIDQLTGQGGFGRTTGSHSRARTGSATGRSRNGKSGTTLTVPDNPRMLARFTKQRGNHGGTGYPQLRLVALLACGTRTLIDAVFGPTTTGETTYTPRLLRSLHAGMILLGDRNFAAQGLIRDLAATEADILIRLKNGRTIPILARYPDGSYLSILGGLRVRVIDAEITIATTAGRHTGLYRLVTTLTDHHRYPASELLELYHHRWAIETAYLELKSSILGGRVLRARTPSGVEQEVYALLVVYQLLRTAMADATNTRPEVDPDRASFSIAYQTARDQLIQATNVIADTVIDLAGTIGRHILADLLPTRRLRVCPRIVKRAISKYQARGPNIDRARGPAAACLPSDPRTVAFATS